MGYELRITAKAEKDLDDILMYIIRELDNMTAAQKMIDEIEKKYAHLKENPFVYEECRDPQLKLLKYRKVVVSGYLLVYRVDEKKATVYVERFFNQLQDYMQKL